MTLDQIKRQAQSAANRAGEPRAVLNYNRAGAPLYVIRDVPPADVVEREGRGFLVATFEPQASEDA